MIPLFRNPTRVTAQAASLVHHILTNNFNDAFNHHQGILCATITDHYGFFHLSAGNIKSSQENEYITKTIDESI